jgi:chromosome segregation ATPase
MNIHDVEAQRKLLEERKQRAIGACLLEEKRLEEIKKDISTMDVVLKTKQGDLVTLESTIHDRKTLLASLGEEIERIRLEKESVLFQKDQEINLRDQEIQTLTIHREGLNKDILMVQRALNEAQTELGQAKEDLRVTGIKLMDLMKSVQAEQEVLNDIIFKQEKEKQDIVQEKALLAKTKKEQAKKENELYKLREDLTIIRDRYARFARENKLPFNA